MSNERYEEMTDEQIVQLAQAGEEPALVYLLNKYKNFVRSKARSYFLIGADHEDIVQEGMIGLFKAIRDYREDRLSSSRVCRTVHHAADHHRDQNGYAAKTHSAQFLCFAQ